MLNSGTISARDLLKAVKHRVSASCLQEIASAVPLLYSEDDLDHKIGAPYLPLNTFSTNQQPRNGQFFFQFQERALDIPLIYPLTTEDLLMPFPFDPLPDALGKQQRQA